MRAREEQDAMLGRIATYGVLFLTAAVLMWAVTASGPRIYDASGNKVDPRGFNTGR
jgi:hypothetical protein